MAKCHHGFIKKTCSECQWEEAYWHGWNDAMDAIKNEAKKLKSKKKRK